MNRPGHLHWCAFVVAGLLVAGCESGDDVEGGGLPEARAVVVPGLGASATITRDRDGMPHIDAATQRDALLLQGWITAEDRLFQIDFLRRAASGTLAELLGSAALPNDIQLRTIGLRRAAERSLAALDADTVAGLQAYADGVNAWVAAHPLPNDYGLVEISQFEPWTPLDSVVIGKLLAFQLSFDVDDEPTIAFQTYSAVLGPAAGAALYFEDLYRSAPFDAAATVPDASIASLVAAARQDKPSAATASKASRTSPVLDPAATELLRQYRARIENVPLLKRALNRRNEQIGSNEWAVAGSLTSDGRPLVANDPHLSLDLPATFHPIHLKSADGLDAIGMSVTGTPWIILGQNAYITWGETTTGYDVTDAYLEQLVPDANSPSGFSTLYNGALEPVIPVPLEFRVNARDGGAPDTLATVPPGGDVPAAALIVPRRNNGPIVAQLDAGQALSLQYVGFSGTRELQSFRLLNLAQNQEQFLAALKYFDVGSQNFIYGDVEGNIGYVSTAEVPLREDLEQGTVTGAPPWFIRNGQGGNEWLPYTGSDPTQGSGYASVPDEQLPQIFNPPAGYVINANNDPAGFTLDNNPLNQLRPGGGLFYLGYTFDLGTRGGRIREALQERLAAGPVSLEDMKAIQADVKLLDAERLTPYILQAFANASAPGAPPQLVALAADPQVQEAVTRLQAWDHSTPTGAATGYDGSDVNGALSAPAEEEIANSIAATIYSVWRGQMIRNTIDATLDGIGALAGFPAGEFPRPGTNEVMKALKHLLERDGVGVSGVDFFQIPGIADAAQRRDVAVLANLKAALDRLAGPDFQAAFGGSTNQADYLWGKLHRIVFDATFGGFFSIPGSTPGYTASFEGLSGIATDGGFGVVDASSHNPRAQSVDEFMFGSGPNRRYVGAVGAAPGAIEGEYSLPGGASGLLGNDFYANLLGRWLTNDTSRLLTDPAAIAQSQVSTIEYRPQ